MQDFETTYNMKKDAMETIEEMVLSELERCIYQNGIPANVRIEFAPSKGEDYEEQIRYGLETDMVLKATTSNSQIFNDSTLVRISKMGLQRLIEDLVSIDTLKTILSATSIDSREGILILQFDNNAIVSLIEEEKIHYKMPERLPIKDEIAKKLAAVTSDVQHVIELCRELGADSIIVDFDNGGEPRISLNFRLPK